MTEPITRQQRILAVDDNAYTVRLVEFTLREAVSYTHLDVYKRQGYGRAVRQ